jgi:hypothetical protein
LPLKSRPTVDLQGGKHILDLPTRKRWRIPPDADAPIITGSTLRLIARSRTFVIEP